mgnify:CR=1 FL=1
MNLRKKWCEVTAIIIMVCIMLNCSGCQKATIGGNNSEINDPKITINKSYKTEIPISKDITAVKYFDFSSDHIVLVGETVAEQNLYVLNLNGDTVGFANLGSNEIKGLFADEGNIGVLLAKSNSQENNAVSGEQNVEIDYYSYEGVLTSTKYYICSDKSEYYGVVAVEDKIVGWDNSHITILSPGRAEEKISFEGSYISSLSKSLEGKLVVELYGMQENGFYYLSLESGKIKPILKLFDDSVFNYSICYSNNEELFINDGRSIVEYDADGSYSKVVEWEALNVDGKDVRSIFKITDKKFLCASNKKIFLAGSVEETVNRTILRLATVDKTRVAPLVAEFNRNSKDYFIQIIEYDPNSQLRLNTELISEDAPDIIELTSITIPPNTYLLEDLVPYFEQDIDINLDDFTGNIIESMLVDGRLTSIIDSYCIQTLAARADIVGDKAWTMQNMLSVFHENKDLVYAFPCWMSPEELLLWVCNVSNGEFIEWESGTCSFDSDEFVAWLKFCKEMPTENSISEYISDYDPSVLMTVQVFQTVQWIDTITKNYMGSEIRYVGFPCNDSVGSYYSKNELGLRMAISATSRNKEAAWEFIKMMFSDNWQKRIVGIPVIQQELSARLSELISDKENNVMQSDIDKFLRLNEKTNSFLYNNTVIRDIIMESAQAYFSGEKSAEDVAAIIQSKVSIYLSEQT